MTVFISAVIWICTHLQITSAGYFWHIADIHTDPYYDTWGENAVKNSCNKDVSGSQGKYGDYDCDSPFELFSSAVEAMVDQGPEPAFVIWSGDTAPHPKDPTWLDEQAVVSIISNCTDILMAAFDKQQIPFVVSLGNHDYSPANQMPAEENNMYADIYELWKPWLNTSDIQQTFLKGAYYTRTVSDSAAKLRVMVVNTNLYHVDNRAVNGDDPGGQFDWMEDTLTQSRNSGERIHLIMHVPPGVLEEDGAARWLEEGYNQRLNQIITDNADVIIGIYSAHQHFDSFRLFYKENNDEHDYPVSSMLLSPSLTPWMARLPDGTTGRAHNPGIRKITFDDDSYELTDLIQYYLDLPGANDQDEANWSQLYRFSELYDVNNISTRELHLLVQDFKTYGSDTFHRYHAMNTVFAGSHNSNGACSCACKNEHICAIQNVDFKEFDRCVEDFNISCEASSCRFIVQYLLLSLFILFISSLLHF